MRKPVNATPGPTTTAALLALAVALEGCGGGEDAAAPPPPPPPLPATTCSAAVDCDDANACTVEGCVPSGCTGTYASPAMPRVLLGGGLGGAAWSFPSPPLRHLAFGAPAWWTCDPDRHGTPNPAGDPPACTVEVDLPAATNLAFDVTATGWRLTAFVPVRAAYLYTEVLLPAQPGVPIASSVSLTGNLACAGEPVQTFKTVGVSAELALDPGGFLAVAPAVDTATLGPGVRFCNAGSGGATIENATRDVIRSDVYLLLHGALLAELRRSLEAQLCAAAPCPPGAVDVGGVCRSGSDPAASCLSRPLDPRTGLLEPASCVP